MGQLRSWQKPLLSQVICGWVEVKTAADGSIAASLEAAIEDQGITHVVPMTDAALLAVASLPDSFWGRAVLLGPKASAIKRLLDRSAFHALARACAVEIPQAWESGREPDRFPVFAKPMRRSCALAALQPGETSLHRLEDRAAWHDFVRGEAHRRCEHWFEEFVPGVDVGLAVLRHGGRVLASFQYVAGRTFPADGGVAVVCHSEAVEPRLLDQTSRLLDALEWSGVAQFDFRRNPHTGRTLLLEMNGRFWGSLGAATYCGQDFPGQLAAVATGAPVVSRGYRTGQAVRWFEGDLRRVLAAGGPARAEALRLFLEDTARGVPSMEWGGGDGLAAVHGMARLAGYWGVGRAVDTWSALV